MDWNKIKCIGNIIIGLPDENEETYRHTLDFIRMGVDSFYSLNIYNLAIYADSELAGEIEHIESDVDELETDKSYQPIAEQRIVNQFSDKLYKLGMKIITGE